MACMRNYSIVIDIKQSPILFLVKEKTNVCCHKSQFLLESRRTRHAPKIYLVEKENIINSHIQSDSILDCFLWALNTGAGTNGEKKPIIFLHLSFFLFSSLLTFSYSSFLLIILSKLLGELFSLALQIHTEALTTHRHRSYVVRN